jgi:predicted enzyme related to lactoylglutathione lyase
MRVTVVLDCLDPDSLVDFWSEALGYTLADTLGTYRILVPAPSEPPGPVFVLQRVAEPKASKNRMHVDVHPAHSAEHIARLEAIGAVRVGPPCEESGIWWQVMADPEGNEFCVIVHDEPTAG